HHGRQDPEKTGKQEIGEMHIPGRGCQKGGGNRGGDQRIGDDQNDDKDGADEFAKCGGQIVSPSLVSACLAGHAVADLAIERKPR
ncbi:MAG: hypothetical protein RLZZ444_3783, partial [Pseudomonadota bacterium]